MPQSRSRSAWTQLASAIAPPADTHSTAPWALGEYAMIAFSAGAEAADRELPAVAAHLRTGCPQCLSFYQELRAFAAEDRALQQALRRRLATQRESESPAEPIPPDPLRSESRRYQQRRWRHDVLAILAELEAEVGRLGSNP